jgi:K+-transporting ATPase, A chain
MEGKEVRFGTGASALAAVVTSNGATGSYNSMDDSFQPLGVAVPLLNMLIGEIVYGGLGTGLYSMIFVALIALFVGGLMIGRTPEHLGKQIGPPEMKIIALYTLIAPVTVLALTALAVVTKAGLAGLTTNTGPHGFTEILFAYASAFANNGQSMAGLSANNIFYNTTTIIAMAGGPIRPRSVGSVVGWPLCCDVAATAQSWNDAFRWICLRRVACRNGVVTWRVKFSPGPGARPDRRALLHPFLNHE